MKYIKIKNSGITSDIAARLGLSKLVQNAFKNHEKITILGIIFALEALALSDDKCHR